MNLKRLLSIIFLGLFVPFFAQAQVTSSSITGTIGQPNQGLEGATITLNHLPTGTVYRTTSQKKGIYNLVNLIPGGPYTFEVSFVGYQPYAQTELFLSLGENTRLDVLLTQSNSTLTEVVVTGYATSGEKKKTGASTSISRAQIDALPTLSRSLSDYTRLTPQANGNSFGGVNNRFNNITIDGAVN